MPQVSDDDPFGQTVGGRTDEGTVSKVKLEPGEAARIAAFLARVVPHGPKEADELHAIIKRLQGGR